MLIKYLSRALIIISVAFNLLLPNSVNAQFEFQKTKEEAKSRLESVKKQSQERVDSLKNKVQERSKEIRVKACEARKNNIEKRLEDRLNLIKQHKTKFDDIYNRIKYYPIPNDGDSIIKDKEEQIVEAGNALNNEISTLESVNTKLDCSDPDAVALVLDIYKSQASSVRGYLKDYRDLIKNYIEEIRNANI